MTSPFWSLLLCWVLKCVGGQATLNLKASAQGVRPAQLYDSTEDLVNRLNDKMRFKLRRIK